jgi:hypothetical protein
MQLWTDYEGVTIDGAFPLQKLLLPEGRSAFFSTAGPKGEPTWCASSSATSMRRRFLPAGVAWMR